MILQEILIMMRDVSVTMKRRQNTLAVELEIPSVGGFRFFNGANL